MQNYEINDFDDLIRLLAEKPEVALDVMRQLSEKLVRSHEQFVALQKRLQPSGCPQS